MVVVVVRTRASSVVVGSLNVTDQSLCHVSILPTLP